MCETIGAGFCGAANKVEPVTITIAPMSPVETHRITAIALYIFSRPPSRKEGARIAAPRPSLPQRRAYFCPWRWGKLESRRGNRRACLVRIRRHDPIAVGQQHIGAVDTQVVVDMQIKLLKYALHRTSAR